MKVKRLNELPVNSKLLSAINEYELFQYLDGDSTKAYMILDSGIDTIKFLDLATKRTFLTQSNPKVISLEAELTIWREMASSRKRWICPEGEGKRS